MIQPGVRVLGRRFSSDSEGTKDGLSDDSANFAARG